MMPPFAEEVNDAWDEFLAEREAAGITNGWNPRTVFEAGYKRGVSDA
jgi:hypothetical protein